MMDGGWQMLDDGCRMYTAIGHLSTTIEKINRNSQEWMKDDDG